ncbi:MAG: hypothetical protein NTZ92_05395 [Candidatus Omnitrophica bacterium]|nr:hypothetical protein [Candidatus Omnitrophota bacterium]
MLKIIVYLIAPVLVITCAFAEAAPWQKGAFSEYVNGDGSTLQQAVTITKPGDLLPCSFGTCFDEEFSKIVREEHRYLEDTFGTEGVDWQVTGETDMEVDIDLNDKFYDKIAIKLLPSQEKKIIYFDITVPYKLIS